ncbi:hypothetical protein [Pandoraea sputorum]|uniref:Uncharacterized protein n=1 Tax=Pandoraea sputorum TaxID=93222 RepID=A0A5E5BKJ8_9BURK|nr:hypothetical protein [Pandoraea sputorum]VVE85632.1 hypothetical protein PSP31121_05334 [Pandoraea sputorum]
MPWMSGLCPALAGQGAIEGKTVHRSHLRGERAIQRVAASDSGLGGVLGQVLGQVRTARKRNEMTPSRRCSARYGSRVRSSPWMPSAAYAKRH